MINSKELTNPFFLLPTSRGVEFIDINNIVRIEAISNYSKLFFKDGKTIVVAKVLKWFEGSLSVNLFIRAHSKHLVNKNFIRQYINEEGGQLKLINGELIHVSRRKKTFVLQSLYSNAA